MRVAFLNQAAGANWGGGEKWTIEVARGLADRGHSVIIYARFGSLLVSRARAIGLPVIEVELGADYSPTTIIRLRRLLKQFDPDSLVVHFNKDVRTGGVAAHSLGIAVLHANGFPIILNKMRHRFSTRFTDLILTVSHRIKEQYAGYGWIPDEKMVVVMNGVDLPDEPPIFTGSLLKGGHGTPPNEVMPLYAVFAGRLSNVKRIEDLLTVWERLPAESRWQLVIVGAGNREEAIRERIAQPLLKGRVHLFGFRDDANRLLGGADLVVLPSEEEGLPYMLLEAMAYKVPVAATPVGDVPILLDNGKAGWLLPVGAVDEWVARLNRLEEQPELLLAMGRAGYERVSKHFSRDSMMDGIESTLRRLVHQKACKLEPRD